MNEMTVQAVRTELAKYKVFQYENCGFINSEIFSDCVIDKANILNMSVNEIIAEYLRMNGVAA